MDILHICRNCRSCCTGVDIRVIPEDIERWKQQNRLDILLSINPLFGESRQLIRKGDSCIFLTEDGSCKIHDTKPKVCRDFPISKEQSELFQCKLTKLLKLP